MRRDPSLDWYYCEARLVLGAPAMSLEPTTRSDGKAPEGLPEAIVQAASLYRGLSSVIDRLDHEHQRILRRYYEPLAPALRRIYGDLGDLAGVVLSMQTDHAELASLVVRARDRKGKDARAELRALLTKAREAVQAAHKAYREEHRLHEAFSEQLRSDRRRRRFEALMRGAA